MTKTEFQPYPQVPEGLLNKIISRIDRERRMIISRQRFTLAAGMFVFLAALVVPVWHAFLGDLARSGFGQYLSLAYSDFRTVAANWQDFSLNLLETLPIISTISLLAVIFFLLITLKFAAKYYGKNSFSRLFAHNH